MICRHAFTGSVQDARATLCATLDRQEALLARLRAPVDLRRPPPYAGVAATAQPSPRIVLLRSSCLALIEAALCANESETKARRKLV